MICPQCKTVIDDSCTVCPACRMRLETQRQTRQLCSHKFCPSCGTRINDGEQCCPHCKMPYSVSPDQRVQQATTARSSDGLHCSSSRLDADSTNVIPRISSAIPDLDEEESSEKPRMRPLVFAGIASCVLVGALALVLVHPWDPQAYIQRATEPADTSKAGFPGLIESLSGQDTKAKTQESETISGDQKTYNDLKHAYDSYISLAAKVDENQKLFQKIALSDDTEGIKKGLAQAQALSIQISNVIQEAQKADVSSGVYAQDKTNVLKLGNYLRNRIDGIVKAWQLSLKSSHRSADAKSIQAPISGKGDGTSAHANKQLFDLHTEDYKPQKKDS